MEKVKDVLLVIGAVIAVLCLLGIAFAIFAGIWEYNPTNIQGFGWKLFGTCVIGIVMLAGIVKLSEDI